MKMKRKNIALDNSFILILESFEDGIIFHSNCLSVFDRKTLMITSTSVLSNIRTEPPPRYNSQDYLDCVHFLHLL